MDILSRKEQMWYRETEEIKMKKRNAAICMALAAVLAGSPPAYAAEWESIPHAFTAKVGTTEFRKDGEARPLDVAVYIKDGYTMLPLRTFMDAALEQAQMYWDGEKQMVTVVSGVHAFTFDVKENTIHRNGKYLPVSGKMEVRDGRIFVPLRNWGNILTEAGYEVAADGITWNNETKTATIHAVEKTLNPEAGLEQPDIAGEGQQAEFALELTGIYDELENIGDGYFITQKYDEEDVGLGESISSRDNIFSLLDMKTGETTMSYEKNNSIRDMGDGWLLVEARSRGNEVDIIKQADGTAEMHRAARTVESVSDGMVMVFDKETRSYGYFAMDGSGKTIEARYVYATEFSEGLAAAAVSDYRKMGYIDKTGKMVIAEQYSSAAPFYEGLARVRTDSGFGFIDREGNEVIPCQYHWAGYFRDGKTYVTDNEGKTWLINKEGEKLKLIAEDCYPMYADDKDYDVSGRKTGILKAEEIIDLPDGGHRHLMTYYDETGQISTETYQLKKGLSEGLAPYRDETTKKYGYVDETGKWVIAPVFDRAEPFEDGYAIVQKEIILADGTRDVEWGIIQHPGK